MWQGIVCNSAGLQAVGSISAAVFAVLGFIVLCIYAWDTRKIARAAINQTKDSLIPFLGIDNSLEKDGARVWSLQNNGLGAAINVRILYLRTGKLKSRISIRSGAQHTLVTSRDPEFSTLMQGFQTGVILEYESLAGEKFRSTFTQDAESVRVHFESLSRKLG